MINTQEYLTGIKSVYDNIDLKYTKVEITTNKNTYTDTWDYVSEPIKDNEERRTYNMNLKKWCEQNNINYKYFFNVS